MSDQNYNLEIRHATAQDRSPIVNLIDSIYAEYGDKVCLEGAESDLLEIPEYFHERGGEFWVLVNQEDRVLGTHAALPIDHETGICGFRRLYLAKELRGGSFGRELMQVTIDWAWEQGFQRIQFWSDTRFERAHRFFGKFGFIQDGRIREMLDGHEPYHEYFFFLDRKDS